jgi:hypothetical protein
MASVPVTTKYNFIKDSPISAFRLESRKILTLIDIHGNMLVIKRRTLSKCNHFWKRVAITRPETTSRRIKNSAWRLKVRSRIFGFESRVMATPSDLAQLLMNES